MVYWKLKLHQKWLIIGDSNLARIPGFKNPDLQIESYPGANFRHIEAILAKLTTTPMVEKVVLSVGLNNRGQKLKRQQSNNLKRR